MARLEVDFHVQKLARSFFQVFQVCPSCVRKKRRTYYDLFSLLRKSLDEALLDVFQDYFLYEKKGALI